MTILINDNKHKKKKDKVLTLKSDKRILTQYNL